MALHYALQSGWTREQEGVYFLCSYIIISVSECPGVYEEEGEEEQKAQNGYLLFKGRKEAVKGKEHWKSVRQMEKKAIKTSLLVTVKTSDKSENRPRYTAQQQKEPRAICCVRMYCIDVLMCSRG